MDKQITIGIPRALLYHKYRVLWENFFKELNCKIITTPETNAQILKDGLNLAVDESCLAVKIYLGHVNYLKDKVDYILVPRIVSLVKKEQTCTKFMGLYDIINNSFDDLKILEYNVDQNIGKTEMKGFVEMGLKICPDKQRVLKAYLKAKNIYEEDHENKVRLQEEKLKKDSSLKILIISHPYTIYDGLVGKNIINFLEKENVDLLYGDVVDHEKARILGGQISTDLYWTYNKEFLGAIEMYKDKIDGIIYAVSFPCGPDALFVDFAMIKYPKIPALNLTIDELQGQAGLMTRLESFVDILRFKRKKQENERK